jgi:hypothetical protein
MLDVLAASLAIVTLTPADAGDPHGKIDISKVAVTSGKTTSSLYAHVPVIVQRGSSTRGTITCVHVSTAPSGFDVHVHNASSAVAVSFTPAVRWLPEPKLMRLTLVAGLAKCSVKLVSETFFAKYVVAVERAGAALPSIFLGAVGREPLLTEIFTAVVASNPCATTVVSWFVGNVSVVPVDSMALAMPVLGVKKGRFLMTAVLHTSVENAEAAATTEKASRRELVLGMVRFCGGGERGRAGQAGQ